jgi:hypothetical protein
MRELSRVSHYPFSHRRRNALPIELRAWVSFSTWRDMFVRDDRCDRMAGTDTAKQGS